MLIVDGFEQRQQLLVNVPVLVLCIFLVSVTHVALLPFSYQLQLHCQSVMVSLSVSGAIAVYYYSLLLSDSV